MAKGSGDRRSDHRVRHGPGGPPTLAEAGTRRGVFETPRQPPTLAEGGIAKNLANRARAAARIQGERIKASASPRR